MVTSIWLRGQSWGKVHFCWSRKAIFRTKTGLVLPGFLVAMCLQERIPEKNSLIARLDVVVIAESCKSLEPAPLRLYKSALV
jgi:hypothetical protein